MPKILRWTLVAVVLLALLGANAHAYSVLTHEELIDLDWDSQLVPLLKAKFPNITPDQLKEAHAYAYGGAVLQDLGYYPFGAKFFSDLAHYVRSGDLVSNLMEDAQDANEYAFALGALSHYVADRYGHPMAVNRAVPIEYPKLRLRFGDQVTYVEAKVEHLRTEFGFDVVQVAKHRYAPQSYHDFIDFKVSKPLLERAFEQTYGLPLKTVLKHEDLAIGSYRHAVSKLIPEMTKVALATRGNEMAKEVPSFDRKKFLYRLSRADYDKSWGRDYSRPGFGARFLAVLLRLVPKVGPFKALAYKDPTPQTEDLYFKSVNATMDAYNLALKNAGKDFVRLNEYDLDTGLPTAPGEYSLTDDTYARWVDRLADDHFAHMTPAVRDAVLEFYAQVPAKLHTRRDSKYWARVQRELKELRAAPTVSEDQVKTQDQPR